MELSTEPVERKPSRGTSISKLTEIPREAALRLSLASLPPLAAVAEWIGTDRHHRSGGRKGDGCGRVTHAKPMESCSLAHDACGAHLPAGLIIPTKTH